MHISRCVFRFNCLLGWLAKRRKKKIEKPFQFSVSHFDLAMNRLKNIMVRAKCFHQQISHWFLLNRQNFCLKRRKCLYERHSLGIPHVISRIKTRTGWIRRRLRTSIRVRNVIFWRWRLLKIWATEPWFSWLHHRDDVVFILLPCSCKRINYFWNDTVVF